MGTKTDSLGPLGGLESDPAVRETPRQSHALSLQRGGCQRAAPGCRREERLLWKLQPVGQQASGEDGEAPTSSCSPRLEGFPGPYHPGPLSPVWQPQSTILLRS